jgi:hypothetical protein
VTFDRWWAYSHLPLCRRQLCWSHLRRDFQAHTEGLGPRRSSASTARPVRAHLLGVWEVYQHTSDRRELKRTITQLRREYKPTIRSYASNERATSAAVAWRATS